MLRSRVGRAGMQSTRRRIGLKRRTLLGGGLAAVAAAGTAVTLPRWKNNGEWRFFTAEEAHTVDAICEQLIPADKDPGARQARVVEYIDIQLSRAYKRHRTVYRQGIAAVDASGRTKFSNRFIELTPEQQVEVLNDIEENSRVFFELILAHTRQGFYGDPRHGGNRGMVSWKMVGLPYPQVRGRMHYDDAPKVG
jgi:gluconate 2-dehydrogenase gamma chain